MDDSRTMVTLPVDKLFELLPCGTNQQECDELADELLYAVLVANGLKALAHAWWVAKYGERKDNDA